MQKFNNFPLRNATATRKLTAGVAALGLVAFSGLSIAQKPVIYPAKGQSAQQQQKDDGQCYAWAKSNTGVDPAAVAQSAPPPAAPKGERAKGAVRGAVVGEVVADNPGGGAAVGAMAGGAKARKNQAAQQQQYEAQKSQALDAYYRAYGACMEGRGYTVK